MAKGKGKNYGSSSAEKAKAGKPKHSNDPNRPSKSVGGQRDASTVRCERILRLRAWLWAAQSSEHPS